MLTLHHLHLCTSPSRCVTFILGMLHTPQNHTEIFGPPLGVFMNYWEAPTRLLPAAAALKAEWQAALMPYVSAWAGGIELEPTFIYGMRIYPEGARLFRRVLLPDPRLMRMNDASATHSSRRVTCRLVVEAHLLLT